MASLLKVSIRIGLATAALIVLYELTNGQAVLLGFIIALTTPASFRGLALLLNNPAVYEKTALL